MFFWVEERYNIMRGTSCLGYVHYNSTLLSEMAKRTRLQNMTRAHMSSSGKGPSLLGKGPKSLQLQVALSSTSCPWRGDLARGPFVNKRYPSIPYIYTKHWFKLQSVKYTSTANSWVPLRIVILYATSRIFTKVVCSNYGPWQLRMLWLIKFPLVLLYGVLHVKISIHTCILWFSGHAFMHCSQHCSLNNLCNN